MSDNLIELFGDDTEPLENYLSQEEMAVFFELDEEQQQLSAGRINGNLLQRITEDKSALLTTLNYLDEMRRKTELSLGTKAPYRGHSDIARRWHSIQQHTQRLRDANQHNGMLLQHQMTFTEQALSVLKRRAGM